MSFGLTSLSETRGGSPVHCPDGVPGARRHVRAPEAQATGRGPGRGDGRQVAIRQGRDTPSRLEIRAFRATRFILSQPLRALPAPSPGTIQPGEQGVEPRPVRRHHAIPDAGLVRGQHHARAGRPDDPRRCPWRACRRRAGSPPRQQRSGHRARRRCPSPRMPVPRLKGLSHNPGLELVAPGTLPLLRWFHLPQARQRRVCHIAHHGHPAE